MDDTYKTLKEPSTGQFKDRGSKFLGYAYPVDSPDQIKEIQAALRKEHHGARHHCYAYRIGPGKDIFRVNDDGEPTNSGGKPILGQIDSYGLSNILIVVVRYFGGTLLGVGGLINAYRTAAKEAILSGEIIEKHFTSDLHISFPYPALNDIMKQVKDNKAAIIRQSFETDCEMVLRVRSGAAENLIEILNRTEGVKARLD
jgi:uncharacterized YigZ family protein